MTTPTVGESPPEKERPATPGKGWTGPEDDHSDEIESSVQDPFVTPLTLNALLERLGYTPDEHLQVAARPAGVGGVFRARVHTDPFDVTIHRDRDLWFGVNPVTTVTSGRPDTGDVTRLAALWVDLDIKDGGCTDYNQANAIIAELSGLIGTKPVAVTGSGHGLQPYWAVEDGHIGGHFTTDDAVALLKRWGRLVAAVAGRLGAGVPDGVFDLPRIMRAPGSVNHKYPDAPVDADCWPDTGAPLTIAEIRERLDEADIDDQPVGDSYTTPPAPPWDGTPPDSRQAKYLAAVLDRHCAGLVALRPGGNRNRALNNAALILGHYVAGAGLPEQEVIARLTEACHRNGLIKHTSAAAVANTIRSGLDKGKRNRKPYPKVKTSHPPTPRPPNGSRAATGRQAATGRHRAATGTPAK